MDTPENPYTRMAGDLIYMSLFDLRGGQTGTDKVRARKLENRQAALQWFNERSQTVFGYGWALQLTNMNPNLIRKLIIFMTNNPNASWEDFQETMNIKPRMRRMYSSYFEGDRIR